MVLNEPLHHRVKATSSLFSTSNTTQSKAATVTPLRRRVRSTNSASTFAHQNEGILLVAALLATVGLSALTISLGVLLYSQYFHPTPPPPLPAADPLLTDASTTTADDDKEKLPWNAIYRVPHSYETVGDRSDQYVLLRKEIDAVLSDNPERSLNFLHSLQQNSKQRGVMFDIASSDTIPYDIYDCPAIPPPNYPFAWNLVHDVLRHWKVNDMNVPDDIHQGLCVFDFAKDQQKALNYRNAELPFIVINDPQVAATAERWNQPNYMQRLLGAVPHRTEYSENSHFMYYIPVSKKALKKQGGGGGGRGLRKGVANKVPKDWKEPTKLLRMPYAEWLGHANTTRPVQPDEEHWYYRLIGCGEEGECDAGSSEYLFDELPFFQPKPSLYIVEPDEQKGIHCRFGMSGVIAENHFDASRNAITVLSGTRRYILTHPNQCANLALYPKGHPSARHSAVDWTNPNMEEYPEFGNVLSNEVVLTAGQVLYLPTDWFHFIVSLELNFQCNTRSGITDDYTSYIEHCGF